MAQKGSTSDPHAKREASRYDNPIPSREYILEVLTGAKKPLHQNKLAKKLDLASPEQMDALGKRLQAMVRDGQLLRDRRGAYALVDRMDLVRCRIQGHRDGYGFAMPVAGEGDDIYLSARQMHFVFDGDEVLVQVTGEDRRGRLEGKVVEVLSRAHAQVVGRYQEESGIGFVIPDNSRLTQQILIPPQAKSGASSGQIVSAAITDYPTRQLGARGRIEEILGDHLDPGLEIDVAIRAHGIPWEWPEAVLGDAAALEKEPAEADKQHRVDLRELPFVTIDGEDAKDFDDAVYCESSRGGWHLWVAIADVSHYVRPDSALDEEAANRGNSVYFPGRVVPMLPEALSNGLCSLKPRVDRLAMVCEMQIDAAGDLGRYAFYEAVIHSAARLTYTQVGEVLDSGRHDDVDERLTPHLQRLQALYRVLREARERRGAIDFETEETRIVFNEMRKIDAIVPVRRNDAHKLIEECMLAANVATARFYQSCGLPMLYRVHEGPSGEKLEGLRKFLGELALELPGGERPSPPDYQRLLQRVEQREDAHIIQTMLLRSLSQAVYRPDNAGHFGLNYDAYTHFTSPIRRYPDLLVHRGIRHLLRSRRKVEGLRRVEGAGVLQARQIFPYAMEDMVRYGEHCSMTERRADDATRAVEAWLKCEYLQEHVGEAFDGVISAVTGFGLFVELKDLYIEGLVHVTALPGDYYHFDAPKQRLTGERSGRSYRLGGPVRVQVARVDLDDRKIDLELLEAKAPRGGGQEAKSAKGGQGGKKGKGGRRRKGALGGRDEKGGTASDVGGDKAAPGAGKGTSSPGGGKPRRKTGLRRHH